MTRIILSLAALAALIPTTAAGIEPLKPPCGSPGGGRCPDTKAPPKPEYPADPCVPGCDATGMWCTSCDDDTGRGGCVDIDGPDISISLCDGEWSWCTDEGDCGTGEFPGCTIDHKPDEGGGSGRCDISCSNGFTAGCSYGRSYWRCDTPWAYGPGPTYSGPINHGNPCTW